MDASTANYTALCHECPAPDVPDETRECEAADLYIILADLVNERDAANARRQRAEEWAQRWKQAAKDQRWRYWEAETSAEYLETALDERGIQYVVIYEVQDDNRSIPAGIGYRNKPAEAAQRWAARWKARATYWRRSTRNALAAVRMFGQE